MSAAPELPSTSRWDPVEIDLIEPPELLVKVGDRVLTLTPIKTRQAPAFARAIEPIAAALQAQDLMGACCLNLESVLQMVCIGAGVEREWLDEQELHVTCALAAQVLNVNADFFDRATLPALTELVTVAFQLLGYAGSTSSRSSSPGDTPDPTSST